MYTKYVDPSNYTEEKSHMDEMNKMMPGMTSGVDLCAVDMNYAYVPMNVTQKSKSSAEDLDKAAKCTNIRFGL